MRIIINGNYCKGCAGRLLGRRQLNLILRYPASSDGKGTCANCGDEIMLSNAQKIIEREVKA